MKILERIPVVSLAATILATGALAMPTLAGDDHVLIEHDAFQFQPGPGSVEESAEFSVLYGDPGTEGVFAMRLKLPDGFHIAPHHHGQPEIVTVLSGTFQIGMGDDPALRTRPRWSQAASSPIRRAWYISPMPTAKR